MARSLDTQSVSFLPYLSAEDAITLATKLEAAAFPPKVATTGKRGAKPKSSKASARPKLTPAMSAAMKDVIAACAALKKEMARTPPPPVLVRKADEAEDAAIGALHDVLKGWARAPSSVPGGDAARRVIAKLFADGASFVHESVDREWAIVEGKLASIDATTASDLALVGATPLLQHLRTVHVTYGEVIGATTPRPTAGPAPQVRKRFDALRGALNQYVLKVVASVDKSKPGSAALRDVLLAPLADKVSSMPPRKAAPKRPAPPPAPAPAPTPGEGDAVEKT